MAGGITENDVWTACDALLLEGARPTIERVRQKIGRGSPNTVSPYLDTWFKSLGGRITDPGTFSAQPAPPDPIVQAAAHFWDVARAESRWDFDERLSAALATSVIDVRAAKNRAQVAEIAAAHAAASAESLTALLHEQNNALEQEKLSTARTTAHLADAQRRIDDLAQRLITAQTQLSEVREAARQEVAVALEHYNGAVRRALLDMDGERTLRAKAEKRVDALERKHESAVVEARAFQIRTAQENSTANGELVRLTGELGATSNLMDNARQEIERLSQALTAERRATERARGEAAVARSFLTQFAKPSSRAAMRKRPIKPTD